MERPFQLETFLGLIILIIFLVVSYFEYAFSYWKKKNVPFPRPSIPFGNCKENILCRLGFGEQWKNFYEQFKNCGKPYCGVYMFTKPVLIILDLDLAKQILSKDFQYFMAREIYCDEDPNDPLNGNLLALHGQKWKNLRSKLTPTFTSAKIKNMFHVLQSSSEKLEEVLEDISRNSIPLDIKDFMSNFTTDVTANAVLGLQINSIKFPENDLRKIGRRIQNLTIWDAAKVLFSNNFPNIFKALGMKRIPKYFDDFFLKIIKDAVSYREKNKIVVNDFLQLLIELKNKGTVDEGFENSAGKLTFTELAAQAFIFYAAGFETSSSAMTFVMFDLTQHEDIQRKVREEIRETLKKYDGEITYESVSEMTYLDKVINESMRLHGVVSYLTRRCTKKYQVPNSDLVIEQGTSLVIPALGYQHDPQYFPKPMEFDPERFCQEEKIRRHPYAFLPFGEGPKNCIGMRFGFLQTKVGLIALLKNHTYTLHEKTRTPIKIDPRCNIFTVLGGVWLEAHKSSD